MAGRQKNDRSRKWRLGENVPNMNTVDFALLAFFWVAIWALDPFCYDKLLCGAAHAILKLERRTAEHPAIGTGKRP
jgi:hypothetical protein